MNPKQISRALSSKYFFFTLCVVGVFLMWKFSIITSQTIDNQSKIAHLKAELEQVQSRHEALKKMGDFFTSDFFAEREARLKFGYQKKGEHAIVLQQNPALTATNGEQKESSELYVEHGAGDQARIAKLPIRFQWWQYFFGN